MNVPRLLPVTAAVALILSACGSGEPSLGDEPVDSPDQSVDSGGMRAPTPIRTTGDGNAAGALGASAEASVSSDAMLVPYRIVTEFIAGAGLGALPGNTTGYVFDGGSMPTADDAARIAAALGVTGEPVLIDDGYAISFRVGPDDGSAPMVMVWDDAMLSWNYSPAWADQVSYGCAVAGSAGVVEPVEVDAVDADVTEAAPGDDEGGPTQTVPPRPIEEPIEEPIECVEPEPPAGVPTAAEAEALAADLVAALGVDASTVTYDTWANEWAASVTVNETSGGITMRSWGFSFGGDAELEYAWGSLATPAPVGPYDLIDLDTAIARLNDGGYGYGGYAADGGIAVLEADVAIASDVAVAELPPDEQMPGGEVPAPEEITVTLTAVDADLWWVWDVDGSAWLVPAYRFTGDDGGTYTVPAVTDEYLIVVDQPSEPPVDPGVPEPMPLPDPLPVELALPGTADQTLATWIGLPLDEFTAAVEAYGWGPVRIAAADGELFALTEDYVIGRVNVAVETRDGAEFVVAAAVELDASAMVAILEVHDGVEYYPACGDERLDFGGTIWYPIQQSDVPDLYAEVTRTEREPFPQMSGLARVVPPGPGDDTGTLVIWADGFARWVSDSGNLDVWLTQAEINYPWVC